MSRFAPFPWAEAMAFGFGVLRLGSKDFWSLTPCELAAAYQGLTGAGRGRPLSRDRLQALMRAYPDKETADGL